MLHLIELKSDHLYRTCFSDGATFFLNGSVNRYNCRYWGDINLHWFHETHTQDAAYDFMELWKIRLLIVFFYKWNV